MTPSETKLPRPTVKQLLSNPVYLLGFGFGAGLSPKAPGTIGTLIAIPLYWLFRDLSTLMYASLLLITFVVGVYLCGAAAKGLKCHDHPGIVWDEFVGYWLTMFLLPGTWLWMLLGFVLFRFFDIVKPWPIRTIDRKVSGGLGIMLDDVIAGLFAWLVLQISAFVFFGYDFLAQI